MIDWRLFSLMETLDSADGPARHEAHDLPSWSEANQKVLPKGRIHERRVEKDIGETSAADAAHMLPKIL